MMGEPIEARASKLQVLGFQTHCPTSTRSACAGLMKGGLLRAPTIDAVTSQLWPRHPAGLRGEEQPVVDEGVEFWNTGMVCLSRAQYFDRTFPFENLGGDFRS